MEEREYERTALEGRIGQYDRFYQGMRQAFAGEGMPDAVRQHAPQYAFALSAARELDNLSKSGGEYRHQREVLQMLIAYALAQTPLKDGLKPETELGGLYRKLADLKGEAQR
jgi:hypothetical protein